MNTRLKLPDYLQHLIESDVWPPSNVKDVVKSEKFKVLIPEESDLYLSKPPFHTVFEEIQSNDAFWNKYVNLEKIDTKAALIIGDFGLGSDAPIILDYKENKTDPKVLRLVWTVKKRTLFERLFSSKYKVGTYWKEITPTFKDFYEKLGLK